MSAAFENVKTCYAELQVAFAALEEAHGRGDYAGPEHEEFLDALERLRAAIGTFRSQPLPADPRKSHRP